jgi:hypothetical protein
MFREDCVRQSALKTNDSTIQGWFHTRTGTGTTLVANDGTSNAGNLYSYGTGTAAERALVTQLSGPTVALLSPGNPLPAPIPLAASIPSPAGA